MVRTKMNSGQFRDTPFIPTHRVIASRGMSFPAVLLRYEGPVAFYQDETGVTLTCHRSEIVPVRSPDHA